MSIKIIFHIFNLKNFSNFVLSYDHWMWMLSMNWVTNQGYMDWSPTQSFPNVGQNPPWTQPQGQNLPVKTPLTLKSWTGLTKVSNQNLKWTNPNVKRWRVVLTLYYQGGFDWGWFCPVIVNTVSHRSLRPFPTIYHLNRICGVLSQTYLWRYLFANVLCVFCNLFIFWNSN